jgi:arylsulfatase A-like enzyme
MTDQQRADLRKSRSYVLDTMPFLDEWAKGGVDFLSAYTPAPVCLPARISMFTGRYAETHRARTNRNVEDVFYEKDMLELLKESGYTTALCGKNHTHHKTIDFDFVEATGHLGHDPWIKNPMPLSPKEEEFACFLDKTKHYETAEPSPGGVEVQHPHINVNSALKFIDSLNGEKPFFIWLSFAEPHNPYQVPEPYFDMFPPEKLPPPRAGAETVSRKGPKYIWLRGRWKKIFADDTETRILRTRSNYHGMLRLIDDEFGRFINGLEERNLSGNTIVIYLSDHGDFMGEYGLIRKGPELSDVLTRIPMVWRGPGIKAQGVLTNCCTSLVDVFPTLCDLLGITIPFGVQGKSLSPLLSGDEPPSKEFDIVYSESGFGGCYWDDDDKWDRVAEKAIGDFTSDGRSEGLFDCLNSMTQCGTIRMIRKGRYKIQLDMLGKGFLYDLETDPAEIKNLFDDPVYLPIKTDMLLELASAMMRTCDPLPPPRRQYSVKTHPKGYWFQNFHIK